MEAQSPAQIAVVAHQPSWTHNDLASGLLGLLLVGGVAAAGGGYFPTTWGWTGYVLCSVAGVVLVATSVSSFSRLELMMLSGLTALLAWTLLSAVWSTSVERTMLEVQRSAFYLAAAMLAFLVVRRHSYRALVVGVWAAIALVSAYALATRLFPERLGVFDPIASYRLSEPIGYWNGLGVFAAMGIVLALGLAAEAPGGPLGALACSSVPILTLTLYFTFSRGGWISLVVGLIGVLGLADGRLRLATAGLLFAPATAASVAVAYHSRALTRQDAGLVDATRQGHRLALIVLALVVANALLAAGFSVLGRRLVIPARMRKAYGGLLLLGAAGLAAAALVHWGGPATSARRAYDAFLAPTPPVSKNLNTRLLSLSSAGRVRQWRIAWIEAKQDPWRGSGAGTYELAWLRYRPYPGTIRDTHNLYLEMLAELGPVGLALLAAFLAVPLAGAAFARRRPLIPAVFGAYVAYLAHAIVDWDWEIPAVTLAALLCGVAMLVAARRSRVPCLPIRARTAGVAAALALGALALVGLIGNRAIAHAARAADSGDWSSVITNSRRAMRWAPWSAEPWRFRAEAHAARGQLAAARADLRHAVAKEPHDWQLWFELAQTSNGLRRRQALTRARRLNPLSPEIAQYVSATRPTVRR